MKVIVINKRNGFRIPDVEIADSFFLRLKGLMLKKNIGSGGLLLTHTASIHTFFMRMNIDIIFIGEKGICFKVVENLGRNRLSWAWSSLAVIEFPAGTVNGKIKPGDTVTFS